MKFLLLFLPLIFWGCVPEYRISTEAVCVQYEPRYTCEKITNSEIIVLAYCMDFKECQRICNQYRQNGRLPE